MEDEKRKQIKLLLKTVSEQQKQMTEQQIMISELLQKVQESYRARSPQNVSAQVAIAIQKPEPEPVVVLEPVVQDVQENFPDMPVVHEPVVQEVQEKFPDMPVVHDDFQEDIPEATMVHEVLVVARQDVHIETVPDLRTYVSYDPYEPLPVSEESYAAHSGACPDDFMGRSENSLYDLMFSDKSSECYDEDKLTSSQVTWMMRDYDSIPCKGYLPIEVRNPSVDVNLDDSMPETIDSSHWSARCNLMSEEQDSEACGILANNSDSDSPPLLNLENGGQLKRSCAATNHANIATA